MTNHHFLLLCCPAQGHVNPTLELAKLLLTHGGGATVTFATTVRGLRGITTTLHPRRPLLRILLRWLRRRRSPHDRSHPSHVRVQASRLPNPNSPPHHPLSRRLSGDLHHLHHPPPLGRRRGT
ncbi:UDP-glycosyltransferase 75D1 [Camellia lanceoleosa]|uniref:UDP-glycosyltransferase 75D1 n=1 Tax=Camellia lanceoleosa TaxID=1840588 RepID=A0ACC0H9S5_9ERIC|nr:UDP-glycosyltransferase 75D1 [Camellia lanceoleosa]